MNFFDLNDVLRSERGADVQTFFNNNKTLDADYRKLFSQLIIEYIIRRKIVATPTTFLQIAIKIVEIFPSEKQVNALHH